MTILFSPPVYSSAHDDLIYTVQDAHASDATTYPNYKYIADVYVNSVMVARLKKVPDPVNDIGIFNVEQVVRNYVNSVFNPTTSLQAQQLTRSQFYIDLQIMFGEEYSYTSYLNLITSSTLKVFNNYNRQLFGQPSSLTGKADSVITNATALQAYSNQQYLFLSYFPTSTASVTIQITPDNGSLFSTTITPSSAYFGQVLNISPLTINTLSPGKINAGTGSYSVKIGAQTFTVNMVCDPRYTTYEIHFLNQYGGYDTKLFNKVSRKTAAITRASFGKLAYAIDSGGQVSYFNPNKVYYEQEYVYASQFTEKMQLNSDLLTDAEYIWLYDLIVSPQVYIQMNGYFIPCVITDNNYEPRKRINDLLTNLTLNIEFGKNYNAQYR